MSSFDPSDPRLSSITSLRLWIPLAFGLFVVLGSIGLLVVFERRQQTEERQAFETLARVNVEFMERTRLQRNARMAERLGEVIGAEVFFRDPDSDRVIGPSGGVLPAALRRANANGKATQLEDGRLAVGVRDQAGMETIFIRVPAVHGYGMLGREAWMAVAAFCLLSLALGYVLSWRVAMPLRALVKALPGLGRDQDLPRLPSERRDEIGSLARVLEQTHESLQSERQRRRQAERLALLGRMATGIAHEIRNPAAAIRLHAELLDGDAPEELQQSRRLILGEAQRLENLVGQWLNYARPEPPRLSEVDLGRLLADVVDVMQAQGSHMGVEIGCTIGPGSMTVRADGKRLQQVFTNLVQNAIQAMPTGGRIEIELEADADQVRVKVRDQGDGFSPTARERLGEPFFSEKEGGLGLGLAVACDICRAHGGELQLLEDVGQGASIRVELPRRPRQSREAT